MDNQIEQIKKISPSKIRSKMTMAKYDRLWFQHPDFQELVSKLDSTPQDDLQSQLNVLNELFHVLINKSLVLYKNTNNFNINQNLLHLSLKIQKQALATFMVLHGGMPTQATPLPSIENEK